jgi:uncharacterized protein YqjF (DUF2071 family)
MKNLRSLLLTLILIGFNCNTASATKGPGFGWIMKQVWKDLSIIHWQVDRKELERLIPSPLKLDTYQGEAYIGVLGLEMADGNPVGLPISLYSKFHQINFRTYVTYNGVRGVYFFSLDAKHFLASLLARQFFYLPYRYNQVDHAMVNADMTSYYKSHNSNFPMEFIVSRKGKIAEQDRTKSVWLTELDRYFGVDGNCVVTSRLWHEPFVTEDARGYISEDGLLSQLPVTVLSKPHFLFIKQTDTYFWPVEKYCR